MPSTPTDIPSVSYKPLTPARSETSVIQPKAATSVQAMNPVEPTVLNRLIHTSQEASLLDLKELLKFQQSSKTKDLGI